MMHIEVAKRDDVSKVCESAEFTHLHADEHVLCAVLMTYAFAKTVAAAFICKVSGIETSVTKRDEMPKGTSL